MRPPSWLKQKTYQCSKVRVGPYKVSIVDLAGAFGLKRFTDVCKYEEPSVFSEGEVAEGAGDGKSYGEWTYDEDEHMLVR